MCLFFLYKDDVNSKYPFSFKDILMVSQIGAEMKPCPANYIRSLAPTGEMKPPLLPQSTKEPNHTTFLVMIITNKPV